MFNANGGEADNSQNHGWAKYFRSEDSIEKDETEQSEIVIEMLTALEEFGIEKLTMLNEIYDGGDVSRSIFTVFPKSRVVYCVKYIEQSA